MLVIKFYQSLHFYIALWQHFLPYERVKAELLRVPILDELDHGGVSPVPRVLVVGQVQVRAHKHHLNIQMVTMVMARNRRVLPCPYYF